MGASRNMIVLEDGYSLGLGWQGMKKMIMWNG